MDTMAIEQYAIDAVRDCVNFSDHLSPFVNDNDKEPSWDGHIYIYGKSKCKEHLKGRVPVQVKGTKQDDLSKADIQFRMSIADLSNYLHDGGCLLLVVYVKQDAVAMKTYTQIYYRELTPVRLQEILASSKKDSKTTLVPLFRMPSTISEIDDMVLNCYNNCKKQSSFSDAPLPTYDELSKSAEIESLSIPITYFNHQTRPEEVFLASDSYLYAKIRGIETLQPLAGSMDQKIISHEENIPITINETLYYHTVTVVETVSKIVYRIGAGVTLTGEKEQPGVKIKYIAPPMLHAYIKDQRFLLDAIRNGGWSIGGLPIDLNDENSDIAQYDVDAQEERLSFFLKVSEALATIGYNGDIDITKLSDQDIRNLYRLVVAFVDKKPVKGLLKDLPPLTYLNIGPLKFILGFQKTGNQEDEYNILNFDAVNVFTVLKMQDGSHIHLSKYALLRKNDFLQVQNIPFSRMLESFQEFHEKEHIYSAANQLLLDLISAYDEASTEQKPVLLQVATQFADWLTGLPEELWDSRVAALNRLQITKRTRELDETERNVLFDIAEAWPQQHDILAGAYLLLDEKARAKRHFDQMSKEEQVAFTAYPIYYFWGK